jgi:hypothetical protein
MRASGKGEQRQGEQRRRAGSRPGAACRRRKPSSDVPERCHRKRFCGLPIGVSTEPALTARASKITSRAVGRVAIPCRPRVSGTTMKRAISLVRTVAIAAESADQEQGQMALVAHAGDHLIGRQAGENHSPQGRWSAAAGQRARQWSASPPAAGSWRLLPDRADSGRRRAGPEPAAGCRAADGQRFRQGSAADVSSVVSRGSTRIVRHLRLRRQPCPLPSASACRRFLPGHSHSSIPGSASIPCATQVLIIRKDRAMARIEKDFLGEKELPADSAYYGVQTLRGKENFHITGIPMSAEPLLRQGLRLCQEGGRARQPRPRRARRHGRRRDRQAPATG